MYIVNNHIKQHVNVTANTVSPNISLSTNEITMLPTPGAPHTYSKAERLREEERDKERERERSRLVKIKNIKRKKSFIWMF